MGRERRCLGGWRESSSFNAAAAACWYEEAWQPLHSPQTPALAGASWKKEVGSCGGQVELIQETQSVGCEERAAWYIARLPSACDQLAAGWAQGSPRVPGPS